MQELMVTAAAIIIILLGAVNRMLLLKYLGNL
jgi:hypothetical protein